MHAGIIATPVGSGPAPVARQYVIAQNLGEASNTDATSWTTHCTLTFTPDNARDYVLFWSLELSQDGAIDAIEARLKVDASVVDTVSSLRTAGFWICHGGMHKVTGAGAAMACTIEFRRSTDTVPSAKGLIRSVRIVALRLESGDQWSESLAAQVNSTGSFTDALTLSFTPASARAYLLLGSGIQYGAGISRQELRLSDGTTSTTARAINPFADRQGQVPAWVRPGLSGAKTYHLQYRCNPADGAFDGNIDGARLLALDLTGFTHGYHAELTAPAIGGNGAYASALDLSRAIMGDDYLVIGAWEAHLGSGQSGTPHSRLVDATGELIEAIGVQPDSDGSNPVFVATIGAYATGARAWSVESYAGPSGTHPGSTVGDDAVIAVLKLN